LILHRCKIDTMIRTQIQLPDELYRRAKLVAEQREISLAEMTRRGLELFLARIAPSGAPRDGWDLPTIDGGGIRAPLERLRDLAVAEEERPTAPRRRDRGKGAAKR